MISLDPATLDHVLGDLDRVAAAAGEPGRATPVRARLETRLDGIREAVAGAGRPRVVALEWLDPPFVGGHWVPEMVTLAGGEDALGQAGVKSRTAGWDEIAAARPDVAVVMPCGLYADEAAEQSLAHREELLALGAGRLVAVDAASSFSRPGPRLVDGVQLLGHLLHPDRVRAPEGLAWRELAYSIAKPGSRT